MTPFEYIKATDAASAVALKLKFPNAQYIAGATNLVDLMKKNVANPSHLIDISRLELDEIEADEKGLRLGALAFNSTVAVNTDVARQYPLITKAIHAGASAQLRNMATIGGNLVQRTRCAYFYDTAMPCNKRQPGSGCGAAEGVNRMSAIFGASPACVAVHPSDLCVALAALDARVTVLGKNGSRVIPFADFHRLPGTTPELDTNLQPEEIITEVFVPANNFARHSYYLKLRDRASYAFALISVAAALEMDGSTIKKARLAFGGVAHKPWRATEAEAFLEGKTTAQFAEAAKMAVKNAQPLHDNGFKVKLLENAITVALQHASQR
jgi:xanthine dehydrogenase YagS FAD-binding subunit